MWKRKACLAVALGMVAALPLAGQLNKSCTVSALNRTTPVLPDGTWVLPNVPANQGPVRVRATCVENGVSRSGQSSFIVVPPRGVVDEVDILFGNPEPIPLRLMLAAPVSTLTAVGQEVQLTAAATFSDGSTVDLTSDSLGTSYRSSNPAIATVDGNGLIAARTSGRVLISALNEGALAVLQIEVAVSGDSDGDGLADDFELANGLDPNNPVDALDDQDEDGLATLAEFQAGLNPFDPDTDDDRLLDGREVNKTGTNPLLFDTDGDRVSDGLEVVAGSNPLDRLSVNLPPILAGLEIDPPAFTIVYNTVLGEGSRRVTVTATLIDGTELDATGAPYGTGYGSTNLSVASFGSEPGRIFAGTDGTATVTATNGTFSAAAAVTVQTFSPQAMAFLPLPGAANDLALDGDYAYVACGGADLQVVDVSNLALPRLVASLSFPGEAFDVAVDGGVAYVAAGSNGLVTVDVGNPGAPAVLGSARTPGPALGVAVREGVAYVVDGRGLRLFDVTDPAAPVALGELDLPGRPRGLDLTGDLAVVAAEQAGLLVIDVSNPAAPEEAGSTETRGCCFSNAADVVVRDGFAYVADGATNLGGISMIDLSVPSTPVVAGVSAGVFGLSSLALEGRFALGADYYFVNGVPIFDIGVLPPRFSSVLDFSRAPSFRDDNGMGIAVRDGVVFLVADRWNLLRFGVAGNSGLHIGRYARLEETNNVPRPPAVALTSPAAGTSIRERRILPLAASAFDDVRVASVRFLVNGQVVATDFAAPYTYSFAVPDDSPQLTIAAEAEDQAGNRTTSEPVVVTVITDPSPTVRLLSPRPGLLVPGGSTVVIAAEATDDRRVAKVDFLVDGELWSSSEFRPYRVYYSLPFSGASSITVEAVAMDDDGQTATTGPLVVNVDPDEPPVVTVLEPLDGATAVAGGVVRLRVGAADDVGLVEVRYRMDGADVAVSNTEPFEHTFRVDPGAPQVRLAATAVDSRGQETTSVEVVLPVEPDPGTTIAGRVVDLEGRPFSGASLICLGLPAASGADGRFSVASVPTVSGRVSCRASGLGSGGEELAGVSVPVPPELGGVTEIGDLVVAPALLYLTDGDVEPDRPSRLLVFDEALDRVLPWSEPFESTPLTGLAFDAGGRLWATALQRRIEAIAQRGQRRSISRSAYFGGRGTRLLLLDPESGEVLDDRGTLEDGVSGSRPAILDLTFDAVSGTLYALEAGSGDEGSELAVLAVDPQTATTRTIASGIAGEPGGLAAGADGRLFLLTASGGASTLLEIDSLTGEVVSTRGTADPGPVQGMSLAPGGQSFRVATATGVQQLDPATGALTPLATPAGITGSLQALAYRPARRLPVTTALAGRVVDENGVPAPDAKVSYLGGMVTPDSGGNFVAGSVVVRTDFARVLVSAFPELVFSPVVPPVAGGITDFGDLQVAGLACVEGFVSYSPTCSSAPVGGPLSLELSVSNNEWLPVGSIEPGPDGHFCATLHRRATYRLRKEDVTCDCGIAACETSLELFDSDAHGMCADADRQCQDIGAVELFCDPFCGGESQ